MNTGLTAAAFLLIGTMAVAQTAPTARTVKPRDASSGQASGRITPPGDTASKLHSHSNSANNRKSGSIIVLDREGQAPVSEKGIGSGNLQRKDGAIHSADFPRSMNAKNSAHATESLSPSNNSKKGENPLYEDSGKSGTNPLHESGKLAATKPNTQNPPAQGKETEFKQDFGQVQPSKKQ
ncbi:hypothetical protein [Edaphobacter sp.]|uniref:hypothetical protein n=1 Tax=Edaphobacter sp. TaxID=1934404 RepID=UPI002DB59AEC|nr:hypothetical protein [Edaphobacter sp.]HEU5341068.1 hypothetical protein [Edaphobacter sp.]